MKRSCNGINKAHGPPLGQAILYISPVDVLALY